MRKTNVFLEVDDNIYNMVIEPHKKAKTFSKLVAALLRGYIEDEYVRAYGDDMVDDLKKASVDSLDDVLSGMHQSLANLGLFTDELSMANKKGSNYFGSKARELNRESTEKTVEKETHREDSKETDKLKQEVAEIRGTVEGVLKQNSEILDMLKEVVSRPSGGIQVEEVAEKPEVIVKPVKDAVNTEPVERVREVVNLREAEREDEREDVREYVRGFVREVAREAEREVKEPVRPHKAVESSFREVSATVDPYEDNGGESSDSGVDMGSLLSGSFMSF